LTEEEKYKVETLLRNYRSLKASLEIELNRIYPNYCIKSLSIVEFKNDKNIRSITEKLALMNLTLSDKYSQKAQVVKSVSDALDSLAFEDKEVIKARYFENKSYEKIGRMTHHYRDTVSDKINNKLLPKLISVGILKAWGFFVKEGEDNGEHRK